jgi:hypothetical protein
MDKHTEEHATAAAIVLIGTLLVALAIAGCSDEARHDADAGIDAGADVHEAGATDTKREVSVQIDAGADDASEAGPPPIPACPPELLQTIDLAGAVCNGHVAGFTCGLCRSSTIGNFAGCRLESQTLVGVTLWVCVGSCAECGP